MAKIHGLVLKPDLRLMLEDIEVNKSCQLGDVLYSGICGTDKHAIFGDVEISKPRILGHEILIQVNGTRFVIPAIMPCKVCNNCKRGHENVCLKNQVIGLTCDNPNMGGWANKLILNKNQVLYKVPDEIDDQTAVLIETMASTNVINKIDAEDKDVLIIGTGPIGLMSIIHSSSKKANSISTIGHKEQYNLLKKMVDKFYEKGISPDELEQKFDVVIDAGGNESSFDFSQRVVAFDGQILESGCMVASFNVNIATAIKKDVSIFTQLGYTPKDFEWAINLVKEYYKEAKRIITNEFKLEEHEKALDVLRNVKHGKVIFSCNG